MASKPQKPQKIVQKSSKPAQKRPKKSASDAGVTYVYRKDAFNKVKLA